jgi:hypothetical protein
MSISGLQFWLDGAQVASDHNSGWVLERCGVLKVDLDSRIKRSRRIGMMIRYLPYSIAQMPVPVPISNTFWGLPTGAKDNRPSKVNMKR